MKKISFFVLFFLSLFLFYSCSISNPEDDQKALDEAADSVGNQENGLIQELSDNSSLIYGSDETSMKKYISEKDLIEKNVDQKAAFTLTYDNVLNTGFVWDDSIKAYKKTIESINIDSEYFTGTISMATITIWFYKTTDATGDSFQLVNTPHTLKDNPDIKSLKYTRHIESELTNKINENKRTYKIDSSVTVTNINDDVDGVHMVGQRISTVTFDGQNYDSNWTRNEDFECDAFREILQDNTYYTTYDGTAHIELKGTIIWSDGQKDIEKVADVIFNKTRYATITVNGSTVTIDVVTGLQVSN